MPDAYRASWCLRGFLVIHGPRLCRLRLDLREPSLPPPVVRARITAPGPLASLAIGGIARICCCPRQSSQGVPAMPEKRIRTLGKAGKPLANGWLATPDV